MRTVNRGLALDAVIAVGWFASVGLVVLHEQGHVFGGAVNPLASIGATLEPKEQWFGVYYGQQKVGFAYTMLAPEERQGMPGFSMMDRGHLLFTLMGTPQQIDVSSQAFIDADWRLQQFHAAILTERYRLQWSGKRHGEAMQLTMTSNDNTTTYRLHDPGGRAMVSGLSSWLSFHRLSVGQWGEVWLLNPISLKPEAVHFSARRKELFNGQEALVIETDVQGVTTTTWVTPDGQVLKEESPMGWTLLQESQADALRMPQGAAVDLLSAVAVPIDRPLAHPEQLTELTFLLEGATAEALAVDRPGQIVLPPAALRPYRAQPPAGSWCLLQMHRATVPAHQAAPLPEAVQRYGRASPFIQSDDPRIRATAREIIGGLIDPWQQVAALNQWVNTTLTKRLTVGMPSATDVLRTRSGDCHEHTVLFTALARSLGIPTRAVAGLVYYQGQLYYHAWPEVWIRGVWLPVDPTLGQPLADATHLGLLEAEGEELLSLGKLVGTMSIRVVEEERGS